MPSPFPGMNPFLEQAAEWSDFHLRFIAHAADALATQAGNRYFVKGEVRLILRELSAAERGLVGIADVGVSEGSPEAPRSSVAVADAPRLLLPLPAVETNREHYLEILDSRRRRVITVIELLSPSNKKPGPDRDAFLAKRHNLMRSVNYVELDLLRAGRRTAPPELPRCDYALLVCRQGERDAAVWNLGVREPLPRLPIPVSEPDPDLSLDIKAVLEETYDKANFAAYLYKYLPEPPLPPADAAWAEELLQSAGIAVVREP